MCATTLGEARTWGFSILSYTTAVEPYFVPTLWEATAVVVNLGAALKSARPCGCEFSGTARKSACLCGCDLGQSESHMMLSDECYDLGGALESASLCGNSVVVNGETAP